MLLKMETNIRTEKKIENNQESSPLLLRRRTNLKVSKNVPNSLHGEQVAAGWPIWLVSVASEAIYVWTPRAAHTFEMLHQISRGARSTEYKAKDTLTSKMVALKKVRIDRSDSVSLRSMARQLIIMRRLDNHPNVIKLEGLVVSSKNKKYYELHLVFEHTEHDLSELAISGGTKLTETQVKPYMLQLLSGLEHCHSLGVLHRNLNGSNLLFDDKGILKISGFGSASFFDPNNKKPKSNRVANLWYRAPELILGATDYGVGIDLWSAGCILGELLTGEPIMAGRTQADQLHQIFKLCGSPSETYWRTSNLLYKSLFMPQCPYKRCIVRGRTFQTCSLASLQLIHLSVTPLLLYCGVSFSQSSQA
ncbi:probable serine/threonine-protein kinase At1g54610 [Papaver somniferum]|uniref:probable serine/threonine-protein kinase At1g54610 n=1 Tax=Papaver somniferum TaxID=3469 RepID=UPI000E6FD454|nr:probable serine/threonine-protein kinase At1g54610 [Papaver somniferum]